MLAATLALFAFAQAPADLIRGLGSDEAEEREDSARRLVERFDETESAIRSALETARNPDLVSRLRTALEDGLRGRARRSLERLLPQELHESYPDFVPGLFSPDPRVVRNWIDAACLAEIEPSHRSGVAAHLSPAARRAILLAALANRPGREVSLRIAEFLEEFRGDQEVAAALHPLLDPRDPEAYATIARALGEIGHASSVATLLATFDTLDHDGRRECLSAVSRIGGEEARPRVEALLRSEFREDRWAGVRLAAALRLRNLPSLNALLDDHEDDQLQRAALATGMISPDRTAELARAASKPVRLTALQALAAARAGADTARGLVRDHDPDVRAHALLCLGASGSRGSIRTILRALTDLDPGVRAEALAALGRLGAVEHSSAALAHLEDGSPAVRYQALWTLRRLGARWTAPMVAAFAADRRLSAEVHETLILWDAHETVPAIEAAAASEDASVRFYAIRALLLLEARSAADTVRARLGDVNHQVRHLVLSGLADLGVIDADRAAARLLTDRNPQLQVRALEYLERAQNPDHAAAAGALLESPDAHVRAAAIRCASVLDPETTGEEIERMAGADPDEHVRIQALRTLARMRRGLPAIVRALRDPEPRVRAEAIRAAAAVDRDASREDVRRRIKAAWSEGSPLELAALAETGWPDFEPDLARMLTHPDRDVRGAAARSLAGFGTRTADGALLRVLRMRDSALWPVAIEAALRLDDRIAIRRLQEHPDPDVRFRAHVALQRIAAPKTWRALEETVVPFAEGVRALFPFELVERVRRRLPGGLQVDPGAEPWLQSEQPLGFPGPCTAAEILAEVCAATGHRITIFLDDTGGHARLRVQQQ